MLTEKLCQCGIAKSQLNISCTPKREEAWKGLFCQADLAIMPSSEKGFGMMALAALSSGLPVLVTLYCKHFVKQNRQKVKQSEYQVARFSHFTVIASECNFQPELICKTKM